MLKEHIGRVVPWCEVEAVAQMFNADSAAALLAPAASGAAKGRLPEYVIDCIDDVNTKACTSKLLFAWLKEFC